MNIFGTVNKFSHVQVFFGMNFQLLVIMIHDTDQNVFNCFIRYTNGTIIPSKNKTFFKRRNYNFQLIICIEFSRHGNCISNFNTYVSFPIVHKGLQVYKFTVKRMENCASMIMITSCLNTMFFITCLFLISII